MTAGRVEETALIEDARLIFLNFSGEEKQYNRKGERNFAVVLDPATAHDMLEHGWKVKKLKDRERDDEVVEGEYYLSVSVNFEKGRPPEIWTIGSKNRTKIDVNSVDNLDYVEMLRVDLIIRPYNYDVSGNRGTKAYLKTMFITVVEDYLQMKYAEIGQLP